MRVEGLTLGSEGSAAIYMCRGMVTAGSGLVSMGGLWGDWFNWYFNDLYCRTLTGKR